MPPSIIDKIEDVGPSCSMVYLFVGMEGTPSELQVRFSCPPSHFHSRCAFVFALLRTLILSVPMYLSLSRLSP